MSLHTALSAVVRIDNADRPPFRIEIFASDHSHYYGPREIPFQYWLHRANRNPHYLSDIFPFDFHLAFYRLLSSIPQHTKATNN
jgi:hypothetical protein